LSIGAIEMGEIDEDDDDDDDDNYENRGLKFFLQNFEDHSSTEDLDVDFDAEDERMIGTASTEMPLFFGGILKKRTITISARSVVNLPSAPDVPCILALSKTESPGILINGGADIKAPGCEMQTHSVQNPSFTLNPGANFDVEKSCVAGSHVLNNAGSYIGNVETNCAPMADPFVGKIPEPSSASCDHNSAQYRQNNLKLSPGVYCGWTIFDNISQKVTFEPGVYVIKDGGFTVNGGHWTGNGVTFYFADTSKIQFNSGVKAQMKAPNKGPYKDIFIAEVEGLAANKSAFILNDNKGFDFRGVVYLPSRQFIFNGNAKLKSAKMNIIADSVIINTSNLNMKSNFGSEGNSGGSVYISQ